MRRTGPSVRKHLIVFVAAAACLVMATWGIADEGEAAGGAAATQVANGSAVTDAQVVASMRKGIDFLLSIKKGDNWDNTYAKDKRHICGETSLVLYALMHAGQSLQDDPEYRAKLHWRSKEIAPVIEWAKKNPPVGTYATGLLASAFTLIPRPQNPADGDEELLRTLEHFKWYFLNAMRKDGGYTYDGRYPGVFENAWEAYFQAVIRNGDKAGTKKKLDEVSRNFRYQFGGPEVEIQAWTWELRFRQKHTKDPVELKKIEIELRELEKYAAGMPPEDDQTRGTLQMKRDLQALEAKNGNPAGLTIDDPKTDKTRPMTRQELLQKIESLKAEIKRIEAGEFGTWGVWGDLSNSQYGILGAWCLEDWGMEIPDKYWRVQDHFWRKLQAADGSWPYAVSGGPDGEGTSATAVAGIASLYIAQEFVDTELRLIPKPDKNIDAGLAWLNKQYTGAGNCYYMYGVERVGLSSGFKYFGTIDWYKTGAARIVKEQKPDGSWYGGYPTDISTAYYLLFLARGRNPVVFNKLQYNGPWNARPRDDAYITRSLSKRFEKPINWQIVNLQTSPDDWHDAPVLLITGSQDPKFTKDDVAKLREFINAGGMIFSTADGGKTEFTTAMKKYAADVVGGKYEMRQLPKNHELFNKDMGVDLPNPPPLLGMNNGVREVWIHSTQDVGADWQMRKFANKTSFELGAALYFYASGMGSLRSKLQPLAVTPPAGQAARTIDVARIEYGGNFDPEPGAWGRMAKLARATFNTQVNLATVKLADLNQKQYPLAHMTGTARVTFTPADVQAVQRYVDAGGLLFIDAAGGNAEFAASAKDLVKQAYPDATLAQLSPDHPIYMGSMPDGVKIDTIDFRKYGNLRMHRRITTPSLECMDLKGKTAIVFSQWDITSGFLGTNTWGIVGYSPQSSEALGRNILLFSHSQAAK